MRQFFASLRKMLVREYLAAVGLDYRRSALGAVVTNIITDTFIPELESKRNGEDDPRQREKIDDVLGLWRNYAGVRVRDRDRTDQDDDEKYKNMEDVWNKEAVQRVISVATKYNSNSPEAENAAQEITVELFTKPPPALKNFDPMIGPIELIGLWKTIVQRATQNYYRNLYREQSKFEQPGVGADDEALDPLDRIPAQETTELDDKLVGITANTFYNKVVKTLTGNDRFVDMFKIWFDEAKKKGADMVNLKEDVYAVIAEKYNMSPISGQHGLDWKIVRMAMLEALDSMDLKLTNKAERRVFKGSESELSDRLVETFYARRVAQWVLSPLPKEWIQGVIKA